MACAARPRALSRCRESARGAARPRRLRAAAATAAAPAAGRAARLRALHGEVQRAWWSVGASDAEAAAVCAAGASSPLFRAALAVARREAQGGGFNSEQAALTLAELVFTEGAAWRVNVAPPTDEAVEQATRSWVSRFVQGQKLKLCPFAGDAKADEGAEGMHSVRVARGEDEGAVGAAAMRTAQALAQGALPEGATALVVAPDASLLLSYSYFASFAEAVAEALENEYAGQGDAAVFVHGAFHPAVAHAASADVGDGRFEAAELVRWAPYPTLVLAREGDRNRARDEYARRNSRETHMQHRVAGSWSAGIMSRNRLAMRAFNPDALLAELRATLPPEAAGDGGDAARALEAGARALEAARAAVERGGAADLYRRARAKAAASRH